MVKQLAVASYTNNVLDPEKVNTVVKHLSRQDLKHYIRLLRRIEKQKSVLIETPYEITDEIKVQLREQFVEKKVLFEIDPSLILGTRITNDDVIYNMHIQNTLENLEKYIEEQYD